MITLEAEKAQQIEESLARISDKRNTHFAGDAQVVAGEALAIIQAARARADHIADADKMVLEPVAMGSVLQRVMASLADLLDEDQFNNINSIVEGAGYAPPVEPVNQEPIGYQYLFNSPFGGEVWRDSESMWNGNKPKSSRAIYAAPVRTKDLTDEEERKIITATVEGVTTSELAMFKAVFRAAIAADREKNK